MAAPLPTLFICRPPGLSFARPPYSTRGCQEDGATVKMFNVQCELQLKWFHLKRFITTAIKVPCYHTRKRILRYLCFYYILNGSIKCEEGGGLYFWTNSYLSTFVFCCHIWDKTGVCVWIYYHLWLIHMMSTFLFDLVFLKVFLGIVEQNGLGL